MSVHCVHEKKIDHWNESSTWVTRSASFVFYKMRQKGILTPTTSIFPLSTASGGCFRRFGASDVYLGPPPSGRGQALSRRRLVWSLELPETSGQIPKANLGRRIPRT